MIQLFALYFAAVPLIFLVTKKRISIYSFLVLCLASLFISSTEIPYAPFSIDLLSLLFAYMFIFFAIAFFAFNYGRLSGPKSFLVLSAVFAAIGVVFSKDLFTLFIFWEFICIISYILVLRRIEYSFEAGVKYIVASSLGSACLLLSVALLYNFTGSFAFCSIPALPVNLKVLVVSLLFAGFGIRLTAFPFHFWAPDVYQSADPMVSAIFSAFFTKLGAYAMVRLFFSAGIALDVFIAVSILTIYVANISAIVQKDIRRLLAFSSIAHMGYILLGLSALSYSSLAGALFHSFNHLIAIFIAFLVVYLFRDRQLREWGGLFGCNKFLGITFVFSLLALAGLPGFGTFMSEMLILKGLVDSGHITAAFLMIIAQLISLAIYLPLIHRIVFAKQKQKCSFMISPYQIITLTLLSVILVMVGLDPQLFLGFAKRAALTVVAYA